MTRAILLALAPFVVLLWLQWYIVRTREPYQCTGIEGIDD